MTPRQRYRKCLSQSQFVADPAQTKVVDLLEDLYQRLLRPKTARTLVASVRDWFGANDAPVEKGLYLWGGVGRGKTMLMDMFFECLPQGMRMRMHFHRFMQRVHQDLTRLAGTPDPLQKIAAELADQTQVLCFDEFFVSDIGDAMILAELLDGLFKRGVVLVATSNVEPANLYENGLQRRRFLRAIDLLYEHTLVHHLGGDVDYRLRVLEQAELYHFPLDDEADASLARSFTALAPDAPEQNVPLIIEGRQITALQVAEDVAWFEFAELCEGPRSQNDYIELARIFHAILVSNVPQFSAKNEDAARRFISLVDELYDRGVKLILSAAVAISDLYQGERLAFEFDRTASRLIEMQSHEYLGRIHKA